MDAFLKYDDFDETVTNVLTTTSIQTHTIAGDETTLTVTNTSTITITITNSDIVTTVATKTLTNTTTETETVTTTEMRSVPVPWYGLVYLSANSGYTVSYGSMVYPTPCFGATGYVFECGAAAATSQGCTQEVYISGANENFNVTIWYPYLDHAGEQPGQNCQWSGSLPSPPGPDGPYYAYCIPVNSTSFLVSQPAPPPA